MEKIQYNVFGGDTRNASGKAKSDVCVILEKNGYRYLYKPSANQKIRVIQQLRAVLTLPKNVQLFVQYPANLRFFYKYLARKKDLSTVAIIHDLESIRGTLDIETEMEILSSFRTLISHNKYMTEYLKEHGLQNNIINLNIFDYLINESVFISKQYEMNTVSFAGNLSKSGFLLHLDQIHEVNFNIYGAEFEKLNELQAMNNIEYMGSFSAEELIGKIYGGWGLVWDGDSLETCSGINGQYLKYNCPHKASMYVVAERPIIIWDQAAMADYILTHHLGISIKSLYDLPEAIKKTSQDEYNFMIKNLQMEKKRLIKGVSLGTALQSL